MATSSKFDLSADSPDRPLYTGGQRGGSHLTAQLDRSGSFRESMENPILSSLPNMTRSSSVVSQGDIVNFFQCLRFDPKVVAADHKSNRHGDFKRHLNVALGISMDDSPSGPSKSKAPAPEEIKRFKLFLRENNVKARERTKIFNEALSVFNKFFPSIPSKKRSRAEGFSSDRPNALLSSDRSVPGPSLGKMGIHNHTVTGGFELEQQKSEERTKSVVPNKRTRTSLVDVRGNALVRPSGTIDRDREMLRLANSGAVQGDDRTLSIGVEGWEKTKMKKKRSGIKPDVSPSLVSTKHTDGYRESKQGMQQRPATDARSRLNSDSHGFRPGAANGSVAIGKSDGISQSSGLSMRSSIPRADLDNNSLLNDRRERSIGSDKERVNLRAANKANLRDDFNSASPTSSTKMNASIRAPRSGSGIAPKLSPVVHRGTAPNEWELSHCTSKPPTAGVTNRKRSASARSSSPPVAHWAGQRPQKISRTARRTNLIPIVSNNDESPALDTVSDVSGNELGLGFSKRLSGNSPQQVKLRNEPLSSAVLSESEESGAPEIKSKDKAKRSDEIDEKVGQNVQKVSTLGLSSRKNKLITGEDLGDGIRRQGRTGRGFTSRTFMPMSVEKVGNMGTAKQLRSARLGFDKNESKAGRPPTRKLSDRKAYPRQKHTTVNATADFLVGSDDGHEELLAAASAVINPAHAFSNSFWSQMETFFGFISDADITQLKNQGNIESTLPSPTQVSSDVNYLNTLPNGYGMIGNGGKVGLSTETRLSEQLVPGGRDIPLCQRLIAAIISEEDCTHGNTDLEFDTYKTEFEMDGESGSNGLSHVENLKFDGHSIFNGYKVTGKTKHDEAEIDALCIPSMAIYSNFNPSINGVISDQELVPGLAFSGFHYDDVLINDNIYLEVQSIGIFPEPMPDMQLEDEGISGEIVKLSEKHREQVSKKKGLLDKLLKSASETKELQDKEFEQLAHDKLLTMAYEKYMACWGPSATGGKSSSNKMAKQAALAFVKRTLDRCTKFEDAGKSCFSEPLFRDIFLSRSSHLKGARSVGTPVNEESGKLYANTSSRSLENRVSASMGPQPSPRTSRLSQNGDGYVANPDLLPPANRSAEQSTGKEDTWSNRVKKRELLLDDVGGSTSSGPLGIGGSLSSSTKGKRSERDREGKGHNREVLSRNGTNKIGRPTLSNVKGERKSKTKPKQKTQLSVSVNGLLGKKPEQPKLTLPSEAKSGEITISNNGKEKDGFGLDVLDDPEAIDLSSLQLPGLDDGQGQDLGSWLNIDDDGLQDHDDFMGLEIPMDDLSDLNMIV
ncbi:uncharacterized protein LOC105637916 isoform X1 [Jatropha curcas]|uniref:uncharacterized protein LOC105637916 isoform X1 n=1 Tax=Jatropha curcas TaxID=180498 RepID=UPI0005FB552C|nr:uncharacterized protein LOC105637916 isoform X1 [Jatropha curcas]XP_037493056.1 uncharacterized protein LOC105637916 isoform X1 [Jatropha curcas]XP_037493057.1 uncharacterized protein LOC105637916 isoform X1 [Jatropha curcas]